MGTWALGPFASDDALDFLADAEGAPVSAVTNTLRAVVGRPAGEYLDVDLGAPAWAASELVAMAFGYLHDEYAQGDAPEIASRLRPKEPLRRLALEALPRIGDVASSELAALWHEGDRGAAFDAALADLRERLDAAAQGPRKVAKPSAGEVVLLPDGVLLHVAGAREAAVFPGSYATDDAALARVAAGGGRRVLYDAAALRSRRVVGSVPLPKALKEKKLYAMESGAIDGYLLMSASGGSSRHATFEEARAHDVFELHGPETLRAIARGERVAATLRSPDEREGALRDAHRDAWARRRAVTTPGPFGDVEQLTRFVGWVESYGVTNAVTQQRAVAEGASGYGRPNEGPERDSYAFAGIVALWLGRWPSEAWPGELAGRLPPRPETALLAEAHAAARTLIEAVLTRDAALRLIWSEDDGGAALGAQVASLREALGA